MASNHEWGSRSSNVLTTCHPVLRELSYRALKKSPWDIGATSGLRNAHEQNELYRAGNSTLDGYKDRSEHQAPIDGSVLDDLSRAVDLAVFPGAFQESNKDVARYAVVNGIMISEFEDIAESWFLQTGERYELVWGGDWDNDGDFKDQSFDDPYHWQIKLI